MSEDSITITLTGKKTVEWIRTKVSRGEFASESDLVAQSIESLREDDLELDSWLKEVVTERYDALRRIQTLLSPLNRSRNL